MFSTILSSSLSFQNTIYSLIPNVFLTHLRSMKQQKTQSRLKACWLLWAIIILQTATSCRALNFVDSSWKSFHFIDTKWENSPNGFWRKKNGCSLKGSQFFLFLQKSSAQNIKMATWKCVKWGIRWETRGVICRRVFLNSTSERHRLGSRKGPIYRREDYNIRLSQQSYQGCPPK